MAFLSYFIYPFPDSIAYATHTFSHLPSVVYCVKYRGCWVYEDPQIVPFLYTAWRLEERQTICLYSTV